MYNMDVAMTFTNKEVVMVENFIAAGLVWAE